MPLRSILTLLLAETGTYQDNLMISKDCERLKSANSWTSREVFNGVSKAISRLLRFCFIVLSDWSAKLAPLFQTNETQPNPITTCSHAFSRAWCRFHEFASNSDWFIPLFTSVVIGQNNFFGFGFIEYHSVKVIQSICYPCFT